MNQIKHEEIIGKVENILFVSGESVEIKALAEILEIEEEEFKNILDREIENRAGQYGLILRRVEDRIQLATRPDYSDLLYSLFADKTEEALTRAMLETLSIIAYKQPVTRSEIEELRGVNCSYVLNVLLEKKLIYEAGRKETIGRPLLYETSEGFLRHFGLESITQLPKLPELE